MGSPALFGELRAFLLRSRGLLFLFRLLSLQPLPLGRVLPPLAVRFQAAEVQGPLQLRPAPRFQIWRQHQKTFLVGFCFGFDRPYVVTIIPLFFGFAQYFAPRAFYAYFALGVFALFRTGQCNIKRPGVLILAKKRICPLEKYKEICINRVFLARGKLSRQRDDWPLSWPWRKDHAYERASSRIFS